MSQTLFSNVLFLKFYQLKKSFRLFVFFLIFRFILI